MVTRTWRVDGVVGFDGQHRLRESFCDSYKHNFSDEYYGVRILEVFNSDMTESNYYNLIRITRETAKECEKELWGQIGDGVYENSRTGKVTEIKDESEYPCLKLTPNLWRGVER